MAAGPGLPTFPGMTQAATTVAGRVAGAAASGADGGMANAALGKFQFKPITSAAPGSQPPASNFAPGANAAQVQQQTAPFVPSRSAQGSPVTPDQAALMADPSYASAVNTAGTNTEIAASARQAAIQAAVEQYGGFAPGYKDFYGDVTPAADKLAEKNPYSEVAQQNRAFSQGQVSDEQSLGARNMLQSGGLTNTLQNEDYGQGLAMYNLANSFGSAVNSAIGNYTATQATGDTSVENALEKAEATQSVNPAYTPSVAPSAATKAPFAPNLPKAPPISISRAAVKRNAI